MIYIAGPFSAPTRDGVEANIRRAVAVGIEVAKAGGFPVIPHANTAHPEFERVQPYEFWIDGTTRMLEIADAVVTVEGWEGSRGAEREVRDTLVEMKPVFHAADGVFHRWVERFRGSRRG